MSTFAAHVDLLHQQYVVPRKIARAGTGRRAPTAGRRSRILAPLALFVVLSLQLWIRLAIIDQGYQLEKLRKAALQNDARLRQQRLEYAMLSRPSVLLPLARQELDMEELIPQRMRKLDI